MDVHSRIQTGSIEAGRSSPLIHHSLHLICQISIKDLHDARASRQHDESSLLHLVAVLMVRTITALSDLDECENELISKWVFVKTGCSINFVSIKRGRAGEHDTYRDLIFGLCPEVLDKSLVFSRPQSDCLHKYLSAGSYLKHPAPRLVLDATESSLDSSAMSACDSVAIVARRSCVAHCESGVDVLFDGYRIVVMEDRWSEFLQSLAGLAIENYHVIYDNHDDLRTIVSLLAHYNPFFLRSLSLVYAGQDRAKAVPVRCQKSSNVSGRESVLVFSPPSTARRRLVGRDAFRSKLFRARLYHFLKNRNWFRGNCHISFNTEAVSVTTLSSSCIVVPDRVDEKDVLEIVSLYAREQLLRRSGDVDDSAVSDLIFLVANEIANNRKLSSFNDIDALIDALEISTEYQRAQNLLSFKRKIMSAFSGEYIDGPTFKECAAAIEYLLVKQKIERCGSISKAGKELGFVAKSALFTYLNKGKSLGLA